MARPKGSKNKPKTDEVLFTHKCAKCGFSASTSIKSAVIGHVCKKG